MNNLTKTGCVALALVAGLLATAGAQSSAAGPVPPLLARSTLPVLGKAPAWVLRDVEGREVKSSDYKGKVVVVDFWATWCPPCRKEIPDYIAWQKKYADRGLVILGLSLDEAPASVVKAFGDKMKINYPLVMADAATAEAFGGVEGLPTAFVIDREGNIRHRKVGLSDPAAYEKLIASLL
ncbi:MAG: TlpA family protein disulfide reductase [Opitutus sp.]|jgi:peroxiredoxin|nr:TlpA family protein disulfide reductase [Opitutus sp.]MCS6248139.1 TlpA family protein disulfide reductase [Opitutus sp.]MCS6274723.1 TlpA family protein disulfide reductase [Opitutus sp.]MCS6277480.1 TlpA family protein disulfide reductase [Opitutus sp.]MCS6300598.1 TlpA family protein disulfide reductase [Opitutus sp.]